MRAKAPGREAWMMFLTGARLVPALGLCVSVATRQSPYISIVWLMAVMFSDLFDGVLARKMGVDTTNRRIADAVVDRITIHGAMAVEAIYVPGAFWLMLPVFLRDVTLIVYNIWLCAHKRSIITAGNIHRTGTALYGVLYIVVLFSHGTAAWVLSAVISITVWFLILDYLRAGWMIPIQPKGKPLARYQARELAALRGYVPKPSESSALRN